jgi:hypothetical protein
MNKTWLAVFAGAVMMITPVMAEDLDALEKDVVARAEATPESAPDYFMSQIELRPAPAIEVQAVYLYGMGLAYERQGDMVEAVDYYRGAELFGHKGAAAALARLNRQPFERPR